MRCVLGSVFRWHIIGIIVDRRPYLLSINVSTWIFPWLQSVFSRSDVLLGQVHMHRLYFSSSFETPTISHTIIAHNASITQRTQIGTPQGPRLKPHVIQCIIRGQIHAFEPSLAINSATTPTLLSPNSTERDNIEH